VTASDPTPASEPEGGAGHFPVVLRGYDRQLVDTRLGELAGQLEQERQQRAQAEHRLQQLDDPNALALRDPPTPSFASLGTRAAKVFEEAGAVAERLIAEAQEQARAIIDAAQAEAAARLQAAADQAGELEQAAQGRLVEAEAEQARIQAEAAQAAQGLVAEAEREVEAQRGAAREEIQRAWHRADGERLLVEAETTRLQSLRQILADQLGQVQTHLGLALRATGDRVEGRGGSEAEADQAEPTPEAVEAVEAEGEAGPELENQPAGPPGPATAAD
jgi:hypothetical protein